MPGKPKILAGRIGMWVAVFNPILDSNVHRSTVYNSQDMEAT